MTLSQYIADGSGECHGGDTRGSWRLTEDADATSVSAGAKQVLTGWWSRVGAKAGDKPGAAGPPLVEQLEPRTLLSADPIGLDHLVAANVAFGEPAICVDSDRNDAAAGDDSSAVLMYLASPSVESDVETPAALIEAAVAQVRVGDQIDIDSEQSETPRPDECSCPTPVDGQNNVSNTASFPIEPRGPPAGSSDPLSALFTATYAEEEGPITSTGGEVLPPVAPQIPGMWLVEPDISSWQGQIIYLDFDGEEDIVYDGPVAVGPFEVPAFQAPGEFAGQERVIIAEVVAQLEQTFANSGIIFTTRQPAEGIEYSTTYIGGDSSRFAHYGSFLGLAEQVDLGNHDTSDKAFVFSRHVDGQPSGMEGFAARLAGVIGHEVGHLLGFAHLGVAQGDTCGLGAVSYMQGDAPLFENSYVHQWITEQAYNFYESQFGLSELDAYLGVVDDSDYGNRYVIEGSCDEDRGSACPWGDTDAHYWAHKADFTRVYDDGYAGQDSAVNRAYKYFTGGLGLTGLYDGGWGTNASRGEGITYQYAAGARETAYYWLGHAAHLLEDVTLPAHAHADPHGLDDFWNMLDEYERYTGEGSNWHQWGFPVIGSMRSGPEGDIRAPQEIEDSIASGYGALYDLFYETASLADDYDSDDANGQKQAGAMRDNGITDAEARAVGDTMMPRAMKAVAELFRLFYSIVDGQSPPSVTLYGISGDEKNPSLKSTVFQVAASASDAISGIDLDGYHFVTWRWNGNSWGTATDWGACGGVKSIGSFSGGLYRIDANVENGAGDVGRSDYGYFYVDETLPIPYTAGDMNWDGYVSIVGDVLPFVRVTYFGDYDWYEQQFPGKDPALPGDCNGDGILSIVGDVPGFVDRVYFGNAIAALTPSIHLYPEETTEPDVRTEFVIGGRLTASLLTYQDGRHGDSLRYWMPRLIEQPSYATYLQYDEETDAAVRLEFSVQSDSVTQLVYAVRRLGDNKLVLAGAGHSAFHSRAVHRC